MNVQTPPKKTGYAIDIQPLPGLVTARRNGVLLAASTRAKVMYETRLPPAIYFPVEDIKATLSENTELQTFCPFKGTATYRDLILDDTRIENAVWSYDDALPESRGIQAHIGFMPHAETDLDVGETPLRATDESNLSGPLIDWLLREAGSLPDAETFTSAFAEKMIQSGIAVSRVNVMIWSLHPMIVGKIYIWDKTPGTVRTLAPTHDLHNHERFHNSPLRHVSEGLGGVRQLLGSDPGKASFPIMEELTEQGASDYVAMPLPFSNGRINVLSLTSDHPDGFTTANLGLIFECSSVISRFYEVFMQKENAQALLETYVGKRSGARVLGGEIRRGDGDEMDAAIMFCDLRGSTRLAETMERADYIALLNDFFETTSTIIHDHNGEVLKFIGDAVLAVFPAGADAPAACQQALQSAKAIVARLNEKQRQDTEHTSDCAIGIAFGRVTYGNVGSHERLDFTVIGRAANVAARLGDYGKTIDQRIVVSSDIATPDVTATDLGQITLHNVSQPVHSFAVHPDAV